MVLIDEIGPGEAELDDDLRPFAEALRPPLEGEETPTRFVLQGFTPPNKPEEEEQEEQAEEEEERGGRGRGKRETGGGSGESTGAGKVFRAEDAQKVQEAGLDMSEVLKLCGMLGIKDESGPQGPAGTRSQASPTTGGGDDKKVGAGKGSIKQTDKATRRGSTPAASATASTRLKRGAAEEDHCSQAVATTAGAESPKRFTVRSAEDFDPGDLVELHGLKAAAQHNGKRGAVLHFVPAKGRYAVELDPPGEHKPLLVKAANLDRCIDNVNAEIAALKAEIDAHTWPGASSDLKTVEGAIDLCAKLEGSCG